MSDNLKKGIAIAWAMLLILACMGSCNSSGGSSGGKKWSEMSELERDNSRWAHEAYEYINGLD